MRIIIQRVKSASCKVDSKIVGEIGRGLLVFLGIKKGDLPESSDWLVNKLINLRLFPDDQGKMNLSLKDVGGEVLVISQFTLYGDCTNGRRPDFFTAALPEEAETLYLKFVDEIRMKLGSVQTGIFGRVMEISLINDGPVTFMIER